MGALVEKRVFQDSNEELAKELADIIHYTVAIAAINDIDLTKTIFDKDKKAAIKYQHERDLESFFEWEGELNVLFLQLVKIPGT